MVTKNKGKRTNLIVVNIYTVVYIKQKTNDVLHSTGNYSLVMYMRKENKNEWVLVYVCDSFCCALKLTHYKSTALRQELNKNKYPEKSSVVSCQENVSTPHFLYLYIERML